MEWSIEPSRVPDLERLHHQVREGLRKQDQRLSDALERERAARARIEQQKDEWLQLNELIEANEQKLRDVDEKHRILLVQRDSLASKYRDLTELSQKQVQQEETARREYLASLTNLADDVYHRGFVELGAAFSQDRDEEYVDEVRSELEEVDVSLRELLTGLRNHERQEFVKSKAQYFEAVFRASKKLERHFADAAEPPAH
mmetsp:Transcript_41271/g.96462  ORF Transcript_41271/g.96462 Transcript_41271/m.96462 type:complete len:201 (-) Transcript_41271:589-1191(-)